MKLDQREYEQHLSQARSRLNLAVMFDPNKHKRDLHGRFSKMVGNLQPGQAAQLPDGTKVERTAVASSKNYQVTTPDGTRVGMGSPASAANSALASSAKSTHADSLGGGVSHTAKSTEDFDKLGGEVVDVGSDVQKAADLLAQGRKVQLDQPRTASVLLDELAKRVNEMKAKGESAPDFDLCKVTVPGTNLFCAESKGIPRVKMPQLSGIPTPGTRADKLPKNDKGEVNLSQLFRQHLEQTLGIKVSDEKEKASYLRASQIELNGGKVAGMTKVLASGKQLGGDPRIFVSQDNYIVDGHHRWAANVGHDLADGVMHEVDMDVARVDMDIIQLLDESNKFAADWGIPQAAVGQTLPDAPLAPSRTGGLDDALRGARAARARAAKQS